MKSVLVTGGAGFIGSHLCERLVARGDRVVCYDNLDPYYDIRLKRKNLAALWCHPLFTFVSGDILHVSQLEKAIQDYAVTDVIHLAGLAGVQPSLKEPARYHEVNVCGSLNVLEAVRKFGLSSLVLASSSSVYGANVKTPFREDDEACSPISPYAASKRAMELNASVYHALYGMNAICLRFFTVYGPRQRPDMAISRFVHAIREGREISIYGDGSSRRDYTYVGDIVEGVMAAVDRAHGCGYTTINLGNSQPVELSALIRLIGEICGITPRMRYLPFQKGDVEITCADITKAQSTLGYEPTMSLTEGLKQYVKWLDAS
jgi:UDP-glucuronate 4-epimerase